MKQKKLTNSVGSYGNGVNSSSPHITKMCDLLVDSEKGFSRGNLINRLHNVPPTPEFFLMSHRQRLHKNANNTKHFGLLILTRCKLIGAVAVCGGGATKDVLFWISSGLSASSMSSSTSFPFVSPRSYHSTVTDRWAGLSFETIAEWTRPESEENCEES